MTLFYESMFPGGRHSGHQSGGYSHQQLQHAQHVQHITNLGVGAVGYGGPPSQCAAADYGYPTDSLQQGGWLYGAPPARTHDDAGWPMIQTHSGHGSGLGIPNSHPHHQGSYQPLGHPRASSATSMGLEFGQLTHPRMGGAIVPNPTVGGVAPTVPGSHAHTISDGSNRLSREPYSWIKKSPVSDELGQNQGYKAGKTRTKDKYRVVYTDNQRLELEKEFCYSKYITIRRKSELAQLLQLSERQVKIWFQNRRAKERKTNKKRDEITKQQVVDHQHHHNGHQVPSNVMQVSAVQQQGAMHAHLG